MGRGLKQGGRERASQVSGKEEKEVWGGGKRCCWAQAILIGEGKRAY